MFWFLELRPSAKKTVKDVATNRLFYLWQRCRSPGLLFCTVNQKASCHHSWQGVMGEGQGEGVTPLTLPSIVGLDRKICLDVSLFPSSVLPTPGMLNNWFQRASWQTLPATLAIWGRRRRPEGLSQTVPQAKVIQQKGSKATFLVVSKQMKKIFLGPTFMSTNLAQCCV